MTTTMRRPTATATRLYALDGLRLACALAVAGYHYAVCWRPAKTRCRQAMTGSARPGRHWRTAAVSAPAPASRPAWTRQSVIVSGSTGSVSAWRGRPSGPALRGGVAGLQDQRRAGSR